MRRTVDDDNIYRLNNIVRYNTQSKIGTETVAAHSYFVSYFIHKLCTTYGICDTIKLMALEAGVLHDVPEVIINDITRDAKDLILGLSDLLQPYEEEVIKYLSERAAKVLFHPETIEENIANALVHYADVISVHQYCENEVRLGNEQFRELMQGSVRRLSVVYDTLLRWIRNYEEIQMEAEKQKEEALNAKEQ